MCLILFSYMNHPRYRLILAANRDEFYERPTRPLHVWPENPCILAGQDERNLGTWLGVTRDGKIGALTNFRNLSALKKDGPSRGLLVSRYLENADTPVAYLESILAGAPAYSGFNLLAGDRHSLYYYSNLGDGPQPVKPGIHGLCNAFLDTAWPKVERGKKALADILLKDEGTWTDDLFNMLRDTLTPPDALLPDTGIGLEWERMLSSVFITSPTYGTRSSAVVLMDHDGGITFRERTYSLGEPGADILLSC